MSDESHWHKLDDLQCAYFVNEVRDEAYAPLFSSKNYTLWRKNLNFLDGYAHYALENRDVIPHFTLDYISNGENHYYLDGSEHPLELLANRGVLDLNTENVIDYLCFFSDVAFYPYRKVKFISDIKHSPYSGASAMKHHFRLQKYLQKIAVTPAQNGDFAVTLPVVYNGETVKGEVYVAKNGEIHITKPVRISLMDRTRKHEKLHYIHPHSEDVLQANYDILQSSSLGQALIQSTKDHHEKIIIISGMEHSFFVPPSGNGYVIAPQNIDSYSAYQLFDIIAALKDLELRYERYGRGDPRGEEEEYITDNALYNLEILYTLCTIVFELEEAGFDSIVKRFKRLGYEAIYSAYKNEASKDELYEMFTQRVYKG